MANPLMTVEVFEDHALISKSGSSIKKPVGIKDMVNVICESAQNVLNFSRSERLRLPENVYLTEYAGNVLNLALYFPEHPTKIQHMNRSSKPDEYEIMFPNTVLHLALKVLNNGARHEVISAFYYCTPVARDNLPSVIPGRLKDVFGYLPFNNVYDNFTLCHGHNTLINAIEGGDLRIFKMYFDILENSPFNNDLGLHNVEFEFENYSEWYEKLAEVYREEKRFPYELVSFR